MKYQYLVLPCILSAAFVAGCTSDGGNTEPVIEDDPATPWVETDHSLQPAKDCTSLRAELIEGTVESLLRHRYGGVVVSDDDKAGGGKGDETGNDDTETEDYDFETPQRSPVEQEDVVKLDGDFMYIVQDDELVVVKANPPSEMNEVGRIDLDDGTIAEGLFVHDGVAVVLSAYPKDLVDSDDLYGTRVYRVDVADPSAPKVLTHIDVEGEFGMARRVDDDLFLMTESTLRLPEEVWELAYAEGGGIPSPEKNASAERQSELRDAARDTVRARVEAALAEEDVTALLPRRRAADGSPEQLLECTSVHLPRTVTSLGTVNTVRIDMASDTVEASMGIVGKSWTAHVSESGIYVAMSDGWGDFVASSHVHKFEFAPTGPTYAASGLAGGRFLDEYSLHASGDELRLITSTDDGARFSVMSEETGRLATRAEVASIGSDALVVANRITADNAFVATYGDSETIYALDLADSGEPAVRGPIDVESVATMIHTIGPSLVLVVGESRNDQGEIGGVNIQVFDLSKSNSSPVYEETVSTGSYASWSEAMWDHRSLSYDPGRGLMAFPVNIEQWEQNDGENFSGLLLYEVSETGLEPYGRIDHGDLVSRAWCERNGDQTDCNGVGDSDWWTHVRRGIFTGDHIFSVSEVGAKATRLDDMSDIASDVLFP